jgi:hypothetical protein
VSLGRSLGYGSYRIVVRGLSEIEPAAVFTMLTFAEGVLAREMKAMWKFNAHSKLERADICLRACLRRIWDK